MANKLWTADEVAKCEKAYAVGGIHAGSRATGRTPYAIRHAAAKYGWVIRGARPGWKTSEVSLIKCGACPMDLSRKTGRSPVAIRDKARRLGVKLAPLPKANEWPQSTIDRAVRMRKDGASIREIEISTGAPFGTIRHWIYGY